MSDSTSAEIYGRLYTELAKKPDSKEIVVVAKAMWKRSWEYDFHACDMDADEALIKLGLARKVKHPGSPLGESVIQYRDAFDIRRWEPLEE